MTGKYQRGQQPPGDSRAAEKPQWMWKFDDSLFEQLESFEALARKADMPVAQYALAWTLAYPAMSSLVVGVKRNEQIKEAVEAAQRAIPPDHFAKLDEISPPPWKQPDPIRS